MKVILPLLLLLALPLPVSAASLVAGPTVKLDGLLEMKSGSSIKFPDGTVQATANVPGPQGPPGPQGLPGSPGQTVIPASPDDPYAPYHAVLVYSENNVNEWFTDSTEWLMRVSSFPDNPGTEYPIGTSLYLSSPRYLKITYSDNIGIYDTNFCKIGIFINNSYFPSCTYSFSGVSSTSVFNHQTMSCYLPEKVHGQVDIIIKHKSSYCHYGNNPTNDGDFNPSLTIEAF